MSEKTKYKRKYRRGGHVPNLDELVRQDFVYWNDKITPNGWLMSWQLRMAARAVGENGVIYYAIKNDEDDKNHKPAENEESNEN